MIKITYSGDNLLKFDSFIFSGGECSVKIGDSPRFIDYLASNGEHFVSISAQIRNSSDLITVGLLKNAIGEIVMNHPSLRSRVPSIKYELSMPYIPYARQDRSCSFGEAFSIKVFASILNSFRFDLVKVVDPHSDVSVALIDNVNVKTQLQLIDSWSKLRERLMDDFIFVSPDAGANKKTAAIAKYYNHRSFIRADKLRDLSSGKILETIVYSDDLTGKGVAIIDDIIDGGRTFIELAKVLKNKGAAHILLYATHGIFSQGVDALFVGGIDEIWTTNSFKDIEDKRINVLEIV